MVVDQSDGMRLVDEGEAMATPAWRRPWFLPTVLSVVLLVLLVTSAVLWVGRDDTVDRDDSVGAPGSASLGMVVAAKQAATNFFSLDYRHAQDDVDRVIAQATGRFKTEYAEQSAGVVEDVTKKKLRTEAVVPADGVAVEFAHGDEGRVLVAIDVTKSQGEADPVVSRNRARITLTRVDGVWLVSNIQEVG